MEYNIKYTGVFLDNNSKKELKNWFKIKKQKELLKNICSDVAVLSVVKKPVSEEFLAKANVGEEVQLEVVGFIDSPKTQVVICTAKSNGKKIVKGFLKIVVATTLNRIKLSNYPDERFIECSGPTLKGKIGYLNNNLKIVTELPDGL